MESTVEDALVEWFEAERLARIARADARRGGVVDLAHARPSYHPALDRLFSVVETAIEELSTLRPCEAASEKVQEKPLRAGAGL